jgi:hypothetical protein
MDLCDIQRLVYIFSQGSHGHIFTVAGVDEGEIGEGGRTQEVGGIGGWRFRMLRRGYIGRLGTSGGLG